MSEKTVHTCELETRKDRRKMRVKVKGYGTIQASKDMLNILSTAFDHASELEKLNNREALSKLFSEFSSEIFIALEETGYYK